MSCGPAGTHGIRPVLGTTERTTCGQLSAVGLLVAGGSGDEFREAVVAIEQVSGGRGRRDKEEWDDAVSDLVQ